MNLIKYRNVASGNGKLIVSKFRFVQPYFGLSLNFKQTTTSGYFDCFEILNSKFDWMNEVIGRTTIGCFGNE